MKKLLPLILFFFVYEFSLAQMYSMTEDTIQIDEVVVTGSPVKVNRNNVPMAVSVVNQAQIEASDESAILPILNGRVKNGCRPADNFNSLNI